MREATGLTAGPLSARSGAVTESPELLNTTRLIVLNKGCVAPTQS